MHSIFSFSADWSSVPQSASSVVISIMSITQAMFKYHRVKTCFLKAKAECPSYRRFVSEANESQVKTTSARVGPGSLGIQGGTSLPRKKSQGYDLLESKWWPRRITLLRRRKRCDLRTKRQIMKQEKWEKNLD